MPALTSLQVLEGLLIFQTGWISTARLIVIYETEAYVLIIRSPYASRVGSPKCSLVF